MPRENEMKNLVLSAMLVGAASQLAGCIIVADDTTDQTGDLDVGWSLVSTDLNNNNANIAGTCPGDTVAVHAERAGDAPYTSKLNCVDGSGPFIGLPEGTYTVWLEITDTSGVTKFAQSGEQVITVNRATVTPVDFSLYSNRAFFAASWNLTRQGAPTTCANVGAGKMSVLATESGGTLGFDDDHNPCTAGEGANIAITTTPVPVGKSYTVVVAALNAAGLSIGDSAPLTNRALQIGNTALDLQTVTIPVQ
jgi:hypothetical protein